MAHTEGRARAASHPTILRSSLGPLLLPLLLTLSSERVCFLSLWMWSQLLLNFQEFLKITPVDEYLAYFLELLSMYSLKTLSAILWDLGLREN